MPIQPLLKPVKGPDLEDRCDRLASIFYRRLTPYCQARGRNSMPCDGRLEWAHVVTRQNRRLRYEPSNHLVLCHKHHAYWTREPDEWNRFVRVNFPAKWHYVQAHRNELFDRDYERWIRFFSN